MQDKRAAARTLAQEALAAGRPLDWFERLYTLSQTEAVPIPWADRVPNPNLVKLHEELRNRNVPFGKSALKVGCGLGDDAEWMASLGWSVTAFDIAPTAIATCRSRFPSSSVRYEVADLFSPPAEWHRAFDIVQESYTLQVLPPDLRAKAIQAIADFVAPGGYLLLVTRARGDNESPGNMPWPLTKSELADFARLGLEKIFFEDYTDGETPPVRRFRACYRRPL
jgi:SAM-dependent methyltransferase